MQNGSSAEHARGVQNFLKYYANLKVAPKYAVLLDGEWGTGKTWLITETIRKLPEHSFLHISLFGLTSLNDVREEIFRAKHPVLSIETVGHVIRSAKLFCNFLFSLFKVSGPFKERLNESLATYDFTGLLTNTSGKILVFDDFERLASGHQEILGFINRKVEHEGQKVIVVLNRDADGTDSIKKNAEKIFGKSFSIVANIEEKIDMFIDQVYEENIRALMKRNKSSIILSFELCDCRNYRILRSALLEYARFASNFPEEAIAHKEFQEACISSFFPLFIYSSTNLIQPKQIKNMSSDSSNYLIERTVSKKTSAAEVERVLREEFPLADIYEWFKPHQRNELDWQIYGHFFEYGYTDKAQLAKAIAESPFFVKESSASWTKLWSIWDHSDADFSALYEDVLERFKFGEYSDEGTFKHVAAMFFYFQSQGIIDFTSDEIRELVLNKLRELDHKGTLEKNFADDYMESHHVFAGKRFMQPEDPRFLEVCDYFRQYGKRQSQAKLIEYAKDFCGMLAAEPESLSDTFGTRSTSEFDLQKSPFLNAVPAEDFVKAYLSIETPRRRYVTRGFATRYKFGHNIKNLVAEKDWLKKVNYELEKRTAIMGPMSKYQAKLLRNELTLAIDSMDKIPSVEDKGEPEA